MSEVIPVNLAVEDALSEATLRRLLHDAHREFSVGSCFSHHGSGYLRRTIRSFNQEARGTPFLVLTDLDVAPCPPALIKDWLPAPRHPNLVFRVAVREVESWLLADREAFAGFARIRRDAVPLNVESVPDPKRCLIDLVRRSRQRDLREDIVPARGSTAKQGPNYNARLIRFVYGSWNPRNAMVNAPSPARAMRRLDTFSPMWPKGSRAE